jgi:hypothetical protein
MNDRLRNIVRALVSPRENENLYRSRGSEGAPVGVRNTVTLSVCVAITVFLFIFVISLSLRNTTVESYLATRTNIKLIDNDGLTVFFTAPENIDCSTPETCFESLAQRPLLSHTAADDVLPLPAGYVPMVAEEKRKMLVFISMPVDLSSIETEDADLMVRLPRIYYEKAELFVGGKRAATSLNRDSLALPVSREMLAGGRLDAHLVVDVSRGQDVRLVNWKEESFIATHYEFRKFAEFLNVRRLNSTSQVGLVARVVLAVFVLLLFIIIESSPEALGLALFMGFEACALTTSFMDLKRFWITSDINLNFFIHYCNAMGDVFRLYFFMQLCRIVKPAPAQWIAWASVYSVIYGLLRHFNVDFGYPQWAMHHIAQRDMLSSTIGFILCFNTIRHLWNRNLPWRIWALSLAGIAAIANWLSAAPIYLPFLLEIGDSIVGYHSLISAVNANSAFLFALSTFINISTLENRVKVLGREKARAEAMEKEMELGRSVQTSFQKVPDLPPDMRICIHYQAAAYVSGDSYFVHWNEPAEVMTFLLNDVTGHGIQAALKAFACNIVARSVWNRPWIKNDRRLEESMLRKYDQAVTELIHADGEVPDFNAMVGVEFHRDRKLLKVYRVNYSFPIVVAPEFDYMTTAEGEGADWQTREISVGNQSVAEITLKEGSFIILVSDGFAENVRQRKSLIDAFKTSVAGSGRRLDEKNLLATALAWEAKKERGSQDDKTVLVFQWNPRAASGYGDSTPDRLKKAG